MKLVTSSGKTMFISDEETYKNYLEKKIEGYRKVLEFRQLTEEETNDLNECMNLYNQIVDYQDSYGNDIEEQKKI